MGKLDTSSWRLDRWLTLSFVAPLADVWFPPDDRAIPILMYHSIADDVDADVHPYFRTVTTPATFARQVTYLQQNGYNAITLSEAVNLLQNELTIPSKSVVLTFDDGFRDFLTNAYPILEREHFRATVFVSSDYIGKPFLNGRDCLNAREIRMLNEQGIEFGSHSVSHRKLVELTLPQLTHEVTASKHAIEDITGRDVGLFSYPYRFPEEDTHFTSELAELLNAEGYRAGVTTAIGRSRPQSNPRFLPRLPMNDCDDLQLLQAKLEGHYDWLHAAQLMRKKSRALLRTGRTL